MDAAPKVPLWSIFASFLKIGAFTFGGGYAMLPLIRAEISERRGWIEQGRFLEMLALAQAAPGPVALNMAVFAGHRLRGVSGALTAALGVVLPSFAVILALVVWFGPAAARGSENRFVEAVFKGVRPAVVALIVAPAFGLARGLGLWRIVVALTVTAAVWQLGVPPVWLLILGALAGIIVALAGRAR